MSTVHHTLHHIDNGAGCKLALHQTWQANPTKKPVLIVPGYGMNSFIFSYHPSGPSMEQYLVECGFEVWRVDLRQQGDSIGGSDDYSIADLARTDLTATLDAVVRLTHTKHERVDVIGASLGGTLLFAHLALVANHKVGSLVTMGTPLRWVNLHPLLRGLFLSPWLVGQLRIKGARRFSELALPKIVHYMPWALRMYMNPDITDTRAAADMVKTVEDPSRFINREIALWVRGRDLVVDGVNLSESIGNVDLPYMCVLANKDGIVPRDTALYPYTHVRSRKRQLVEVGSSELLVAHADMFVSKVAQKKVFQPIADWLS